MRTHTPVTTTSRTRGFTLVEMLVAVTLVLLIMLLMAQVFTLATDSMVKQKGTAENDQQARTFTTILRADLQRRSFFDVSPFYPRTANELIEVDPEETRRGYFSYSENDPSSALDDKLTFTLYETEGSRRFIGRTTLLRDPAFGSDMIDSDLDGTDDEPDEGEPGNYLFFDPNQPEGDDGAVSGQFGNPYTTHTDLLATVNGLGMSKYAEVSYFLRGTNLHRRVMLLRDPYEPVGTTEYTPSYVDSNYPGTSGVYAPNGSGEFWADFDYSAFYLFTDDGTTRTYQGPRFNSLESLSNHPTTLEQLGELLIPLSLGVPNRRFGHNFLDGLSVTLAPQGRPREFVRPLDRSAIEDANGNGWLDPGEDTNGNGVLDDQFIGQFLTQETSDPGFNYPGRIAGVASPGVIQSPFNRADLTMNPVTYEVTQYQGNTSRRGEDILLTNVTEFDVQILDDGLPTPRFVNLGHSEKDSSGDPIGFYNITKNQSYIDSNSDGLLNYSIAAGSNKFQLDEPLLYGNRYDTWYARKMQDIAGIELPPDFYPYQRPPYRPYSPGPDGNVGDLINAGLNVWTDLNGDNLPDYYDANGDGDYDPPNDINGNGLIEVGTAEEGDPLAIDQYGFPGSDDIPYAAKAIKITVRFVDPSSNLVRQVTIIESLNQ